MRILHFIYDDTGNPWLGGGGAVRTREIYSRFPETDSITVITGNYPGATPLTQGVLHYKRVGVASGYAASRLSYSLSACRHLSAGYDLVVEDVSAYSPLFLPLLTRRPAIAIVQNLYGKETSSKGFFIGTAARISEAAEIKLHANFIAVSRSIARRIESVSKRAKNIWTAYNGLPDGAFQCNPAHGDYILSLGRLDIYQKGLDILLRAYASVAGPSFPKLVIAGGGKDESRCLALIRELGIEGQVTMAGKVQGDDKKKLLAGALFVCMPSRFESWGMVAMEAAACGKTVLGSDIEGLNEAVVSGSTGLLVPREDYRELARAMKLLAGNRPMLREYGAAARLRARAYTWEMVARYQRECYEAVIANG